MSELGDQSSPAAAESIVTTITKSVTIWQPHDVVSHVVSQTVQVHIGQVSLDDVHVGLIASFEVPASGGVLVEVALIKISTGRSMDDPQDKKPTFHLQSTAQCSLGTQLVRCSRKSQDQMKLESTELVGSLLRLCLDHSWLREKGR